MEIMFNGRELPNYVFITGYNYDVVSELSPYITEIPYKIGNIDGGVKRGNITHIFDLTIDDTILHTPFKVRQDLKRFVMGNDWEVGKLISSEWEGRYINARVSTSPNIQDLFLYGTTTLEFVSTDPLYYSDTISSGTISNSTVISYDGLEPVPSIITITPNKDIEQLRITNKDTGNFIRLQKDIKSGNTVVVNSDKKQVLYKGRNEPEIFALESRWIYLEQGDNELTVEDKDGNGVTGTMRLDFRKAD